MSKYPLLHIHPQAHQHDEAYIVGNREGLTKLRDLLTEMLGDQTPQPQHVLAFCADGEGYEIHVIQDDEDWCEKQRALPYTDHLRMPPMALDEMRWPWDDVPEPTPPLETE